MGIGLKCPECKGCLTVDHIDRYTGSLILYCQLCKDKYDLIVGGKLVKQEEESDESAEGSN
jgi:uncharacterized protein YbaR (Trm112 family)